MLGLAPRKGLCIGYGGVGVSKESKIQNKQTKNSGIPKNPAQICPVHEICFFNSLVRINCFIHLRVVFYMQHNFTFVLFPLCIFIYSYFIPTWYSFLAVSTSESEAKSSPSLPAFPFCQHLVLYRSVQTKSAPSIIPSLQNPKTWDLVTVIVSMKMHVLNVGIGAILSIII